MQSGTSEARSGRALLAVALLCGCARSDAMAEILTPLPELPSPGNAVVVFVRPSTYVDSVRFAIIDDAGRFLGHSLPATWFEAHLAPGRHVFYADAENTPAVRADLGPDRTYYIEVGPKPGWFRPRVHLLPIAPRFPSWAKREEWLAESVALRLEHPHASDLDPSDISEILEDGRETLADYSEADLERRTIRPSDGL